MSTYNWGAASVQVAFQNNPFDTSPTWTDITRYVEGFTTSAGRQHELQQVAPSTCNLTLSNQTGIFSPWNTGSPYYYSGTGLIPGHPVRVVAQPTSASVTTPVFYGYIKGFIPSYGMTKATMTIQCYDVLALLNLNTMDVSTYPIYPTANADHYWPFSDSVGSQSAQDVTGGATMYPVYATGFSFGAAGPFPSNPTTAVAFGASGGTSPNLFHLAASISGSVSAVEAWVNAPAGTTGAIIEGSVYLQPILSYGSGTVTGAVGGSGVTAGVNVADGTWHYVAATVTGSALSLYVDGASVAGGSGHAVAYDNGLGHLEIGGANSGIALAQIATYSTPLAASVIANQYAIGTAGFLVENSGSRISAVLDLAGVPGGQNNVGTGVVQVAGATSSLATTTMMSYINTVVNSERGLLYQDGAGVVQFRNRHYVYENASSTTPQATFGASVGHLHYFSSGLVPGEDDLDLWNNIPVSRSGGVTQTAFDATSQASYGRRTLTGYTNLLFTNDGDSYDLASGLLYQYKQPAPRIRSISMDSTIGAGANMAKMIGLKLLDRVTVYWRPLDGSSPYFTQQSLVEQVTHSVTPEVWTTTFAITPIGTETFFILDTSILGPYTGHPVPVLGF